MNKLATIFSGSAVGYLAVGLIGGIIALIVMAIFTTATDSE